MLDQVRISRAFNTFYRHVLGGVSYEEFKKIFANNKNVIEEFVLENSNIETLEKWVEEKSSKVNKEPKTSRGANQLKNWKVI